MRDLLKVAVYIAELEEKVEELKKDLKNIQQDYKELSEMYEELRDERRSNLLSNKNDM